MEMSIKLIGIDMHELSKLYYYILSPHSDPYICSRMYKYYKQCCISQIFEYVTCDI